MLGFHVHFDQGYSNVENRTSKKILRFAFSVISVYDLHGLTNDNAVLD